jgi:hypothetical protein
MFYLNFGLQAAFIPRDRLREQSACSHQYLKTLQPTLPVSRLLRISSKSAHGVYHPPSRAKIDPLRMMQGRAPHRPLLNPRRRRHSSHSESPTGRFQLFS